MGSLSKNKQRTASSSNSFPLSTIYRANLYSHLIMRHSSLIFIAIRMNDSGNVHLETYSARILCAVFPKLAAYSASLHRLPEGTLFHNEVSRSREDLKACGPCALLVFGWLERFSIIRCPPKFGATARIFTLPDSKYAAIPPLYSLAANRS